MRSDEVEPIRLVDRVFDLVVGQAGREVDEHRDRVPDGDPMDEAESTLPVPMCGDSRTAPTSVSDHRHIDGPGDPVAHPPKLGSALMAQPRTSTARQNRGHQLSVAAQFPASHRVNAAMHFMQATVQPPLANSGWRHPEAERLGSPDHAMLSPNQVPDG
jgi:hypothetical protein